MATIESVVKVNITKETNQVTIQDLNTIAVLSEHTHFSEDFRIYTATADMITDGFLTTDFAYKAAQIAFSQNPQIAKIVIGKKLVADSYPVAFQKLNAATGQWLFLIADASTDSDIVALATEVQTTEKFYVISTDEAGAITTGTTDILSQLNALTLSHTYHMYNENTNTTVPEAGWLGRFSSDQLGSDIWIYKPIAGLLPSSLSATQESALTTKNSNWYTTVAGTEVMFGTNKTAGGDYIDVELGIVWLKVRIRERIWGTLLNARKINMDTAGVAKIEADLRAVLQEGIDNGILAAQPAPQVIVPNVLNLTPAQRATRNLTGITFRARLAGAIQTVKNIEGVVYA